MNALVYLEVTGPDGQAKTVPIAGDRLTVGRLPEVNDLALDDDPERLVSRYVHCLVEREGPGWCVVDNGSNNGTFLRKHGSPDRVQVQGRAPLRDGDTICILASLSDPAGPAYWKLVFRDPLKTRDARLTPAPLCLEYDLVQATLTRVEGEQRTEIRGLRPLEHKLVRYMAQRNRANGNVPVLCSVDELLAAVWDEETLHTPDELSHLIWGLRRKIEPDRREPKLLRTERGLGYRLHTGG